MKLERRSYELTERRCQALRELGFEPIHDDFKVDVYGTTIDFSTIGEEHFLKYAFLKTYAIGKREGRDSLRKEIKSLLEPEGEVVL